MGLVSRSCINAECGTTAAEEWRKGWALRSGGHANLCGSCGMAYEQSIFCDLFHAKESGWRECSCCGKRLHCGCVASRSLIVLVDDGGVRCLNCAKNSDLSPAQGEIFLDSLLQLPEKSLVMSGRAAGDDKVDNVVSSTAGRSNMPLVHRDNMNGSFKHVKREEIMLSVADLGLSSFPSVNHGANSSSQPSNEKRGFNSISPGCLGISIGASLNQSHAADPINFQRDSHLSLSTSDLGAERWEQVHQGQQAHPRPLKSALLPSLEPPKEMPVVSHLRIARPPGEGKGRNHLLPRYWPRITDQELKQISGDSNSTIVPLFEKVLSASDAGRIGRLVLPKACAEAYFPPISQPEGLPLRIQDAKGNDWIFQFRFWPNNNSRMYVLEGVTPCIQAMQLQAGDTVTFSRIDPEGKLVMGFRKATNSVPLQDSQISAIANGNESFLSGVIENLQYPFLSSEKRRSRNISSKRKRLHIDREDALELKLTWEEAQDLLRAPPNSTPSIVVIENYEFEEYEEPPVLAKRTIFTSGEGVGANDQWVQCDDCYKWRRVPADAVVLSKWACADNVWDQKRSSCSDPDEMGEKELQDLLLLNEDFKKRKLSQSSTHPAAEPADLETLASLAVMNYDATPAALSDAAAATTRHPRHRPGCSCIVCIQPPSGKGPKHKPTCPCNVCLTVRRRFKTLMLRKKKRQSEQQAQLAHLTLDQSAPGSSSLSLEPAQIDLNSRPERGSMMSLLQVASFPLEKYLKEKGLSSLAQDRHGSSSSSSSSHAAAPPAVTGSGDGSPERDSGGE